ncbi:MAG: helix-hairpin-helix domain-containing protein [Desertimonas sp.]
MAGVEERGRAEPAVAGPEPAGDEPVDDWGPDPWQPRWRVVWDRAVAVVRPWVAWFGVGRVLGGALTVIVAVGVGWWLLRPADPPTEAVIPYVSATSIGGDVDAAAPVTSPPAPTLPAVVVVHVAGAVVAPGIVELAAGSRVADAVELVGGAQPDADLGAINLAAPLQDGQQVYVPRAGEAVAPVAAVPGAGSPSVPTGPVDLNRASEVELDALPGIGPATAAAIVAHRDANGPFASVDDLEAVRGIGPAKLDALRGLVTT